MGTSIFGVLFFLIVSMTVYSSYSKMVHMLWNAIPTVILEVINGFTMSVPFLCLFIEQKISRKRDRGNLLFAITFVTIIYYLLQMSDVMDFKYKFSSTLNNVGPEQSCWTKIIQKNKNHELTVSPDTMLCLFEPINDMAYKRYDKRTVVIGIGVHIGPILEGKYSIKYSDIEFVSWGKHDKNYDKTTMDNLYSGFNSDHLLRTQRDFWEKYRNDTDLKRADIIVCGFDVWHCLIFAPFNKKLVINSAYRFDGHTPIHRRDQVKLQKRLYDAVRYNPNVIISGEIVYDIAYSQHFLGSYKIIPLSANAQYVLVNLKKELKKKNELFCNGVPSTTTGYHPTDPFTVMIGPKSLSVGGAIVANEIYKYFLAKPGKYKVQIMQEHMKRPYHYCELGRYSAMIILGYSVMSFFTVECSVLGIPMFIPTPRLYAEWERDHHLIRERKAHLDHATFDDMNQSSRSLNFGYNPNDDFGRENLERWVSYSDAYYYKGHMQFDSYDELYEMIETADLQKMHENMLRHTKVNAFKFQSHWKSIDRYFHGNKEKDIVTLSTEMPVTLEKGFELWANQTSRPNFQPNTKIGYEKERKTFVVIDYDIYTQEFNTLPDCGKIKKVKVLFFRQGSETTQVIKGCEVLSISNVLKLLPKRFKSLNFGISPHDGFLIMLLYVTTRDATTLITIEKEGCNLDSYLQNLVQSSDLWKQRKFLPRHYFSAWLPLENSVAKLWMKTVSKFSDDVSITQLCNIKGSNSVPYLAVEISRLKDYLYHWDTDETANFYYVLDQLNFELAVKGYMSKSDAILYRYLLEQLAKSKTFSVPNIKKTI